VRWSLVLDDLSHRIPADVWLTSSQFTQSGTGAAAVAPAPTAASAPAAGAGAPAGAGATATTAPTSSASVGSVTFTGAAASKAAVASWLDSLATVPGFSNPYVSSISTNSAPGSATTTVSFTSTVSLTPAALSNRYATPNGAGK
jgi:Tfp pilus assembly protein PilN